MAVNQPTVPKIQQQHSFMHSPLVVLIGGVLLGAAFVFCSFIQIQTSEAYLLGKQPTDVGFTWSILYQLLDLLQGKLVGKEMIVEGACWVVEIITVIVGVCLEVAAHGVRRSSEMLSSLFVWLSFGLLVWNGFTDYQYAPLPSGFCGQSFVALAISIGVVFGLPACIECLTRGGQGLRR